MVGREGREVKSSLPLRLYFGGKKAVAAQVWRAFGDVGNYTEPFAGSLAVLLGRPTAPRTETVNDLDGFITNFWRMEQLEAQLAAAEERLARAKHWLGELKHLGEIQMKAEALFIPSVFGESWDKGWKNGHEAAGMACQALAGHGLAEVEALDAGREGK